MTDLMTGDTTTIETHGRVATFTWPAMTHEQLDEIIKELKLTTPYPRMGVGAATQRAAMDESDSEARTGGWRLIVRSLSSRVCEFVREVVVPSDDNEVKGQRTTIARVLVKDGKVSFDAYSEAGVAYIEERAPVIRNRIQYYMTTVQPNDVGDWADDVVVREFRAAALANRGHSFHLTGAENVKRFDRFIEMMRKAANQRPQDERITVFKTVDNDPASLASIVASMRLNLEKGIEAAMGALSNVKTKRGVDGLLAKLSHHRVILDHYRSLLGNEVDQLIVVLEKAEGTINAAELVKDFAGLDA